MKVKHRLTIYVVMCLFISIFMAACSGSSTTSTPAEVSVTDTSSTTSTPAEVSVTDTSTSQIEGIIYAKIIEIEEDQATSNYKTALITIDKGSQDGISHNLTGWILIHKASIDKTFLLQAHIMELTDTTTVLTRLWYDSLSIGQSVLVTEPDIDTEILLKLMEE